MDNQTPEMDQHPDPAEAPTAAAARTTGLRRLFKRRPVMTGSALGAVGMALALAVAGVMSAGAQSSDDGAASNPPATAPADDGTGSGDGDADSDDGDDGHRAGDRDSAPWHRARGFLHRFRAPTAEERAAFESFKTCLADAGVSEGFEHDKDGTEVSVMGPDGFSIVQLGDGSVTVTRDDDDVTITTTGDATVMDKEDLRAAWQTEAAAWKAAYEDCRDQLPERFRGMADAGKELGERFAEDFADFDEAEFLGSLGLDADDLAEIGEHFAEEFAGIGEGFAEEFSGRSWW